MENDKVIQYGTCRYCGQVTQLHVDEGYSTEELNELATENCNCAMAVASVEKYHRIEEAKSNIEEIVEKSPEALKILNESILPVAAGLISKVVITAGDEKVSLSTGASGNIVVEKTITRKVKKTS